MAENQSLNERIQAIEDLKVSVNETYDLLLMAYELIERLPVATPEQGVKRTEFSDRLRRHLFGE